MVAMYFFLIFFILLSLFMGVVWFERKRNKKFFEEVRAKFDVFVQDQQDALSSLDIIQALEYIMRYLAHQVSHVTVALLHFAARRSERMLRKARKRLADAKPVEEPSHFVKSMKEIKEISPE
ncbi:MAG: hypothetical protein ACJKSS_01600 [Patescibacteria group bacterium UBA2103]